MKTVAMLYLQNFKLKFKLAQKDAIINNLATYISKFDVDHDICYNVKECLADDEILTFTDTDEHCVECIIKHFSRGL